MTAARTTATAPRYPRTVDNGGGERLTFVRRGVDGSREWLEVENEVRPGCGPLMHAHPNQEESLTVRSGTLGYVVAGEPPRTARKGETVTFPRGVAHRFWNAGPDVLRCTGVISPPLRFEYFITALFRSFAEHGGRRPGLFDVAFLVHHFRAEGTMVGIPAPVRHYVLPLVRRVGERLGRYERFRDAPG